MFTTQDYIHRDLDADLMVRRLRQHRDITTEQAKAKIECLKAERSDRIRNYKECEPVNREIGSLLLLIRDRELWSDYCFDECSHWVGNLQ